MLLEYKILAVDFDGTLCEDRWPEIGHPNHEVIEHIKKEKTNGTKIILWTCRIGDRLQEAINFCTEQGIIFDEVNKDLPEVREIFGRCGPKIYFDEIIDDKNHGGFKLPFVKGKKPIDKFIFNLAGEFRWDWKDSTIYDSKKKKRINFIDAFEKFHNKKIKVTVELLDKEIY